MPSKWLLIIGGVLTLIVAYWFIDEYVLDDTDEVNQAAKNVGERARGATESAARGGRFAVVGFAGLGVSLAMELLQLAGELNAILGGAPVVIGHLIFGAFTLAGLQGVIPFDKQIAGFFFIFVTAIALILRYGDGGG
ncbi:hypothetical protein [Halobellus ruber]|uniref:Uncharacterized protein n=1 Tax=Halobellus ruber TaxID=2761102 RepID=A0A7J9SFB8_9EURY|nr:hypothetical protein [Halobellus ruber]MBB6645073.1 hypothetical protein [Halobellus ruber]